MTINALAKIGDEKMEEKGRNVLVGIRMDWIGIELLDWAVFKIARPKDCIIALHVVKESELSSNDGTSSVLCLAKQLNTFLALYEDFCAIMQVSIVGKLSCGKSIRKTVIQEAKECSAVAVIVGACKNNGLRSSISMAKYCAKRLAPSTHVIGIHNGKIIFQRDKLPIDIRSGMLEAAPVARVKNTMKKNKQRSNSKTASDDQSHRQEVADSITKDKHRSSDAANMDVLHTPVTHDPRSQIITDPSESESSTSYGLSPSISFTTYDSPRVSESRRQMEYQIPEEQEIEKERSLVTLLIRKLPEEKPGWPLLRRASMSENEFQRLPTKCLSRSISVVQWALQLPNRSLLSSPYSYARLPENVTNGTPTRPTELVKELESLHTRNSFTWRRFNYHELQRLSHHFSSGNLIGKGGGSKVYKVTLPNGKPLAVKISKVSEKALQEFLLEVEIISSLRHRNIISLVGVCIEDNMLISTYDFFSRGSLEMNLHGDKVLSWDLRFKIAVGIGEALDYLHNGSSKPVIHRDVKSSNILLSYDYAPKLSDFGLAIWAPTSSSYETHSDIFGTFGYIAPEYFMFGKVSDKIDVYSFGVVLLELLSGRKAICSETPKAQESLIGWATSIFKRKEMNGLVDSALRGKYNEDEMKRMLMAASLCIRRTAHLRPRINLVLRLLKGDKESMNWAEAQVFNSKMVDHEYDDDEADPEDDSLRSLLNRAMLDGTEDDASSVCSIAQHSNHFLENYHKERRSRRSSSV